MTADRWLTWSLVIPVKVLAQAKSRLERLAGPARPALALAVAADTVRAALACARVRQVIVVTDDTLAAAELGRLGALVVADEPGAGLNPALAHGFGAAISRDPRSGVGALSADLPALKTAELGRALRRAARWPQAIVSDASGTGTTLYTARPGAPFRPRFGPGSRLRHLDGGAHEITHDDLSGLRRDVDTAADLVEAAALGLGPATAELAARLLPAHGVGHDMGHDMGRSVGHD
jgi:2-phospho-L-lactate/phosphoenolpyruvate guanylyltransferase